jgi:phage recombination protein Bet
MSNEVKTIDKVAENKKALLAVIKKTIFKNADDAELALYVHKCTQVGVNVLDKAIIPIKFKDNKEGGFVVSFITTIDLYRSMAEDTGQYDGCDEAVFEGEIELPYQEDVWENGKIVRTDDKIMKVPEIAKVTVYRKDMTHPTIGTARWKEYYPGQKRGDKWRQMPYGQLAKCAEANALRKAFPKKLNKLYTEEEMQLTMSALAGVPSLKDTIQEPTGTDQTGVPEGDFQQPDDETRKANRWISTAQENRLYKLCQLNKVNPENVKQWFKTVKQNSNVHLCHITWAGPKGASEYDKICQTIEKQPRFYDKYVPVAPVAAPASSHEPTPREIFEIQVQDLLESAGLGNERLDAEVKKSGFTTIKDVPEASFGKFLHDLGEAC